MAASEPHERPANCPRAIAELVEDAKSMIDAGWAAAAVVGCGGGGVFRFIEFDGRWWIVHIELSHAPGTVQLAR